MVLGFLVAVAYWPGLISAAVVPRWAILAVALPLLSWLDPRQIRLGIAGALVVLLLAIAISLQPLSQDRKSNV